MRRVHQHAQAPLAQGALCEHDVKEIVEISLCSSDACFYAALPWRPAFFS
jgi:hypothetical protein